MFYVLTTADRLLFGTKWAYFDRLSDTMDFTDYEWCPVCGRSVSRTRQLPPLRIRLSSGKPERWGDFVWGTFFTPLVSDNFRQMYEKEKLTGIKFFHPQAEVVRVGGRKSGDFPTPLPTYYFIEVAWGGANQDDLASELVREHHSKPKPQGYCFYCHEGGGMAVSQKRVSIEPGSWTGMDIFEVRGGPPRPVVSERFMCVVEEAGLKNCCFIPTEKYAYELHHPTGWHVRD